MTTLPIHNLSSTPWRAMPEKTRNEILDQEIRGAVLEYKLQGSTEWRTSHVISEDRKKTAYRIKPGTETTFLNIHNDGLHTWEDLALKTKVEIEQQELLGGVIEYIYYGKWCKTNLAPEDRKHQIYRVKPGTEVVVGTPLPLDEIDLTQLGKPVVLWHPLTLKAMKTWPHGIERLSPNGSWLTINGPNYDKGICYRAKPAPELNLIDKVQHSQFSVGREEIAKALLAANALIEYYEDHKGDFTTLLNLYKEAIK
jgi:parvulin-like peptidyl-prolyl isomerase